MGHQINQPKAPRRGSLQFYPRVRAKRIYPRIRRWPKIDEVKLLGFAGYKVGMAHVMFIDERKNSPTNGQTISIPVTILDVPKIQVIGIVFYGVDKFRRKVQRGILLTKDLDKNIKRKISFPKKSFGKEVENPIDVTVLVATLPEGRVGKKKPEIFEIAIGGSDVSKKLEYAKGILGKKLSIKDVVKEGDVFDVVSITKGKGFEGAIRRFGARLESKKSDRGRRMISPIGEDVPRKTNWRVPMSGQMGFFQRTEKNKQVLKIGDKLDGSFHKYGVVRGEYIIIAGSVPGPRKRLIRFKFAMNPNKKYEGRIERLVI